MTDNLSPAQRKHAMACVRSRDTTPEMFVRRSLHRLGYRYRLHCRNLPGSPDLVFPSRHKIIFVHGCFWHQHRCKRGCRQPATNKGYWREKLSRNVVRDRKVRRNLRKLGWDVLVVWECQTLPERQANTLRRLRVFLDSS